MAAAVPVFLGLTAISGVASAVQQRKAGKEAERAYQMQARQEEVAGKDREIERRRQLVRALSSQNAEAGAFGIDSSSGSRRAMALYDTRLAGLDSLSDRASTNRNVTNLQRSGRAARRQGNLGAFTSLLDAGGSIALAGVK